MVGAERSVHDAEEPSAVPGGVAPADPRTGAEGWQVPVTRTDGELRVKDLLFSGVAFYQNAQTEELRIIKCHGRDGIYAHATKAVAK